MIHNSGVDVGDKEPREVDRNIPWSRHKIRENSEKPVFHIKFEH